MEQEFYQLTDPQKSIYLTEEYYKNTNINNISGIMKINDIVNFDKFILAIKKFVEQNDSFRIFFNNENNEIKQYVHSYEDFPIEIINIDSNEELFSIANQINKKPFFIYNSYLFKFFVFRFPNNHGGFIINVHHLIADSWALGIAVNEIIDIYYSYIKNKEYEPKDISLYSYTNYISSEIEYKKSSRYEKDQKYWNEIFSTIPDNATIPSIANNKNDVASIIASRKEFIIPSDLLTKINDYCKKEKTSLFNFFIAIYSLYISRVSNTEDFCVGTPILNRTSFKEKQMTGMFINVLPLRINIDNSLTFKDFLNLIATNSMSLLKHHKYSYQNIIQDLRKEYNDLPNLYNIMISYQITKMNDEQKNVPHTSTWLFNNTISDDIDIHIFDLNDTNKLNIAYDYKTDKYTDKDIKNIHNRILGLISQILDNLNIKLSDIEIITPKEKELLIHKFNNTKKNYPSDKNVVQLFQEQVIKNKDKTALVFENTKLTYNELNQKSNQLANYLLDNYHLKPQDVVGIFLDKSIESIIAIIGIIKAGGVFVPIDTEYPEDRINYILEDSNAKVILTKQEYKNILKTNIPQLCIDISNSIYEQNNLENPVCLTDPEELIYMMYTSGSTGKPKGVMISHKNVVRLVKNTNYIEFTENERILQTGSIVFDACTFEIWGALLNGGTLYLIRKQNMLNQNYFEKYLKENKITSIFLTTALFNQYCETSATIFKNLKNLLTGGEAVSVRHIKLALNNFPQLNLVHVYGPTENTTFSTYHKVKPEDNNIIPIGKAIANSTTYVVSKNEKLLPIGVPGELWVGGDGVGKGYLNREDLSKEKFIDNPFGEGKIYKTGDLVKLLPNGDIEFIGRIDNQVKIRGFRIELNEIDSVIHEYPYISKTHTIIKLINDKQYIVTYFTADKTLNTKNLSLYLQEKLPSYMMPQFLIQLDSFPLTINGKIDVDKLPIPKLEELHEYIPPENEIQEQLCSIWSKLFKMKKVSILDNFFELGGDSLTAIKFQTEALKLNININYSDIFEYPTIKSLSEKKQDKQLYKVDENYDYSKINELLKSNTIENIEKNTTEIECNNLLLCGATGFLGAHILDKYLSNTQGNIYCLVRKKENIDSVERLKRLLNFYFDDKYNDYFGNRIHVIYGDITLYHLGLNDKEYKKLGNIIDVVINSAAFVKHFGDFKLFDSVNVVGTQNIIDFCKNFDKKLYHISTMSVRGINTPDEKITSNQERILFNETNFYVNQNLNNAYVFTKFEAEKEILEEIPKGLKACILRMGNISSRLSDGKFQINASENAYINRIKSFLNIKVIQNEFLNHSLEFTPVDSSADAIIKIIENNPKFTVLHIFNTKLISIPDLLAILKSLGYSIDVVDNKTFSNIVKKFLKDDKLKSTISGFIPYLNSDKNLSLLSRTLPNGYFSTMYLNSIGFEWCEIDANYIRKYMEYFKKIGYIE